jgi:uncharacterized protein
MAAGIMTEDDGQGAARRPLPHPLALAYFGVFASLLIVVATVALFGRASDGDPVVRLDLAMAHHAPKAVAQVPASIPDTNLIGAAPLAAAPTEAPAPPPADVPAPAAVPPGKVTQPVYAGRALVADPALIEQTGNGPLPRIADDGRTPMSAYAPPVPQDARPRIAIVVSGLGISAKATAEAVTSLPPGVTLAFAPYADDVQRWVSQARSLGHEVLLEVPMEPYDFPDSDPGPHTLRASAGENANIDKLSWSLTRITGYAGITNLLGGRFLANDEALEPVMVFLARRGLLFFDSGSTTRSAAPSVAHQVNAPYVQSVTTIDTIQTGMEIDRRLSELESRARLAGSAAGTGFIYPVTIDRVNIWAKGLQGRGFVLVPASAIVAAGK